jgi:hypothetical protein
MLALTELFLRLSRGKHNWEVNDGRIRLTVEVSSILISELSKSEFSLFSGDTVKVNSEIRKLLQPYLMSKRTYGSRYRTWRPEKFIKVSAVPVSTLFERTQKGSTRYSSYTKGYGESHGNAHKSKTKPSMELDGDPKKPDREERNLILRMTDLVHQKANILRLKFENLSRED